MAASKIKLGYTERDKLFKKEYNELKIKVALNWFEIIALIIVTFFITLKATSLLQLDSIIIPVSISLIAAGGLTFLFCCFRKYQLKITRFDREHIYKKISKDLIESKGNE